MAMVDPYEEKEDGMMCSYEGEEGGYDRPIRRKGGAGAMSSHRGKREGMIDLYGGWRLVKAVVI